MAREASLPLQDGHLDRRAGRPLVPEQRLARAWAEERGPRNVATKSGEKQRGTAYIYRSI